MWALSLSLFHLPYKLYSVTSFLNFFSFKILWIFSIFFDLVLKSFHANNYKTQLSQSNLTPQNLFLSRVMINLLSLLNLYSFKFFFRNHSHFFLISFYLKRLIQGYCNSSEVFSSGIYPKNLILILLKKFPNSRCIYFIN